MVRAGFGQKFAVFKNRVAQRIFDSFQEQEFQDEEEEKQGKLLTISASRPVILSLPWELLRDPYALLTSFLTIQTPCSVNRFWMQGFTMQGLTPPVDGRGLLAQRGEARILDNGIDDLESPFRGWA